MRIKAVISYDGTNFAGYQVQPNKRTVQLELERVLMKIHKGEAIKVVASGRTDARVHATGQVIHFDTPLNIRVEAWQKALNVQLPDDIRVRDVQLVTDDFHARYGAVGKRYRYIWSLERIQSPFRRHYAVFMKGQQPDVKRMKQAAHAFLGTHDFSAFCAANTSVVDKVRTIHSLRLEQHPNELHLIIEGNGFLYNMVRIIAGTLWDVGMKKIAVAQVPAILASQSRDEAGKTAPPHGLYLEEVWYA